ncbi:MAG: redox-regulated ATPase YchF [Endomicrobiia bacterium]
MQIGIVGLPNVGKSTLFNALTNLNVPAENYPFTTIEPNIGIVTLPDERLETIGKIFQPEKLTYSFVKFVDIAGLVEGASKGLGLGNKFLSHIREVDAIIQVVGVFSKTMSPQKEIEIVETELILADLEQALKIKEKLKGPAHSGDKESQNKLKIIEEIIEKLNQGESLGPEYSLQEYNFLTTKPVIYVLNVNDSTDKQIITEAENFIKTKKGCKSIVLDAKLEFELSRLGNEEKEKFKKELGITSRIDELIKISHQVLGLIIFYTVVGKEIRAWSIPQGSNVKKAAGKIHSDFEKGFICAEVYSYNDLIECKSEKAVRDKGLIRTEGKDYIVKDGDIIYVKFH